MDYKNITSSVSQDSVQFQLDGCSNNYGNGKSFLGLHGSPFAKISIQKPRSSVLPTSHRKCFQVSVKIRYQLSQELTGTDQEATALKKIPEEVEGEQEVTVSPANATEISIEQRNKEQY